MISDAGVVLTIYFLLGIGIGMVADGGWARFWGWFTAGFILATIFSPYV